VEEIRIGLTGLGARGRHWLKTLDSFNGYRVTAICDPIEELHEISLAVLKDPESVKVYARYEDFLADPNVDAVALTVRCKEQGALAAQALEAGKHVNSEVPAAHTMEDCWRIVVAAERSGKVYQLAEQSRFSGVFAAWRDLVREGKLGKITFCEGQYIGYKDSARYHRLPGTAQLVPIADLAAHPEAEPSWINRMPPIHYLPHELSPILMVIDDRVKEVTAMSTSSPSYVHSEIHQPDIQLAIMKTEKDTLMRLAVSYTQPTAPRDNHWCHIMGTKGSVELARSLRDKPKLWLADGQMHDLAEVDWRPQRTDAPAEARGSGHSDTDYYIHASFRDAVLHNVPLEFNVYKAMNTAAPAVLASESIAQGSTLMQVPDFRPGPNRREGELPG
jgi:predicted dehydrogenase